MTIPPLDWHERMFHRDELRASRYAALADAEGFEAICFAVEALGMRLRGRKENLGKYEKALADLAQSSVVLSQLSSTYPGRFSTFSALFCTVKRARNDAMHSGVFARHATAAAIELCIGLEEALMKEPHVPQKKVKDFMVKSPVVLEPWQPVAHARQLMLTHSFSYLPVYIQGWKLVTEYGLARYLRANNDWAKALSLTIQGAGSELQLISATVVGPDHEVENLLEDDADKETRLWLVEEQQGRLCGVLSPFELM
ncbi:CBS domain-containing protein [Alcaligenes faecalis]|uniref:CBS domain-containing protein n=1 Tax=Alcaligenes faecalis TaxID=511 RepID=UPI000F4F6F94|nr:CBS domain-containing protein [Alcaligenes faecalis]MCX5595599.1 hypothetical protein [Alcaligenes faecalis]QQC32253.1 hypothetical protein I6H81_16750 [Alcaligenes faecalis]